MDGMLSFIAATVPGSLRPQIEASQVEDLVPTCAALATHFMADPFCRWIFQYSADPYNPLAHTAKNMETAMQYKEEGNAAFKSSSFTQALKSYTQALRYCPFWDPSDRITLATLFVNRAAALLALDHLMAATRDCTRALGHQPDNSKAWYRRGQAYARMQNYEHAVEDLEGALALQTTPSGREQVSRELERARALVGRPADDAAMRHWNCGAGPAIWESGKAKVHEGVSPVWTADQHWEMRTTRTLRTGTVALEEEPVAAIVNTQNRESLCHFCFDLLPPDPVACFDCAIPLYCDDPCLSKACDETPSALDGRTCRGEHMHECDGCIWSLKLPTDAILAGRLFARSGGNARLEQPLSELCQHYNQQSGTAKLEMHIRAVFIAWCERYCVKEDVGAAAAKLVRLLAVVRSNTTTANSQQVAQAVYILSSKFTHARNGNVKAWFGYRHLQVQTKGRTLPDTPLELDYGA